MTDPSHLPVRKIRAIAAGFGHKVSKPGPWQAKHEAAGLYRWTCSCGMYGTARTNREAIDGGDAHLRAAIIGA